MLAVDEDLRTRGAPARPPDHLATPRRLFDDVDLGVRNAFALQQGAGAGAIGAEHRRVKLNLGHCGGHSEFGSRGLPLPFNKAATRRVPSLGDYPPPRSARARVNTPIEAAPARFSTRAHSST